MQSVEHRESYGKMKCANFVLFAFISLLFATTIHANPLAAHLQRLTSALSSRNLDSLRLLIEPTKVFVELSPKPGSYLSPSQTLAVIESFFQSHLPISFSYILVKEEKNNGIAIGSLTSSEEGRRINHKVNFGFQKSKQGDWILTRINIK
jgi:hypothetical protein